MSLWSEISRFFGGAPAADDNAAASAVALAHASSSPGYGQFLSRDQILAAAERTKSGDTGGGTDPVAHGIMSALNWVGNLPGIKQIGEVSQAGLHAVDRVGSTALLALQDPYGQTPGGVDFLDFRDAWNTSEHTTLGQAANNINAEVLSKPGTYDVHNAEDVKEYNSEGVPQLLSGTVDFAKAWYLDPTVLVGKAVGGARSASRYNTSLEADRARLASDLADPTSGISTTVNSFVGQSPSTIIQHQMVRESSNPELVAHSLSLTRNFDEAATVVKALSGDGAARNLLKQQSAYINNMLDRAEGVMRNPLLKANDPKHYKEVADIVSDLKGRSAVFQEMIQADRAITDAGSRIRFVAARQAQAATERASLKYGKAGLWSDEVYQSNPFAHPVRVIKWLGGDRPAGILGTGDMSFIGSSNEITAYVATVKAWSLSDRRAWVDRWVKTTTRRERMQVADQMQRHALASTAKQMHPELPDGEISQMVDHYLSSWNTKADETLRQAQSGDGTLFAADDGEALVVDPELMSQLGSSISTAPVEDFRKALMTPGLRRGGRIGWDAFVHGVDALYAVWRPAVLWHMGFTFKQSIVEPNLRGMAYFNQKAWTDPLLLGRPDNTAMGRFAYNLGQRAGDRLPWRIAARSATQDAVNQTVAHIDDLDRRIIAAQRDLKWFDDHVGDYRSAGDYVAADAEWFNGARAAAEEEVQILRAHLAKTEAQRARQVDALANLNTRKRKFAGQKGQDVQGVYVPGPAEGSFGETMRNLSSAEGTVENTLIGPELSRLQALKVSGAWTEIAPKAKNYFSELADRLDRQFRSQIPMRMIAKGASHDDVVRWLRTPKGKMYMRQLDYSPVDADSFALLLAKRVSMYTHEDEVLLARLANDEPITERLVTNRLGHRDDLNPIHGHPLEFDFASKDLVRNHLRASRDWIYHKIAALPENRLSRHPFYDHVYKDYVSEAIPRRLKEAGSSGRLTQAEIDDIVKAAHRRALHETIRTIYTISRYSNIAAALRWASPFFQATLNQFQVWGRLFRNNPAALAHYYQAMRLPEDMDNLFDSNGRPTDDPWDPQSHMVFQAPAWVGKLPGFRVLLSESGITVSPHALDPILQGEPWYSPGAGPVIGMVASEMVKNQPRLEQVSKDLGILPYGPSRTPFSVGAWAPSDLRQAFNLFQKQDSQVYSNTVAEIYQAQVLDWKQNGSVGPPPSIKHAVALANQFFRIRVAEAIFSPVSIGHDSKYAAAINDYHQMQSEDPQNAMSNFLDKWGLDWAEAMLSLSKNDYSVAPNIATEQNLKKYPDLVDAVAGVDPSMVGALFNKPGEFSDQAYGWQLSNSPQYGSTGNYRDKATPQQAQEKLDASVGWNQYLKLLNTLDVIKASRGLGPTDSLPDDLQFMKSQWVQSHMYDGEGNYSAWYKDYSTRDDLSTAKRAQALQLALDNPQWSADYASNPMWVAAGRYLGMRQTLTAILQVRDAAGGSDDIAAQSNADIARMWVSFTTGLAESNTDWSDFYHRYFESDALVPLPTEAGN